MIKTVDPSLPKPPQSRFVVRHRTSGKDLYALRKRRQQPKAPQRIGATSALDGTHYALYDDGSRRRDPKKPYANKAERKIWKAARQAEMLKTWPHLAR